MTGGSRSAPGIAAVRRALATYRPSEAHAPTARPAAVALILAGDERDGAALFIERAIRPGDPWSGQIALPGGRWEAGDTDLLATAIRETREETGLDLVPAERLGVLDDLHPRTPVLPDVVVRPFVFALPRAPELSPSDEVRSAFWVPLAELAAPGARRDVAVVIHGVERTLPAYRVGPHIVWGMTERIITPFLGLVTAL